MRVLFQPRIQNFLAPAGGGLKRQVLKTREFLEKTGVEVTMSLKHDENLADYDVVHLFSPDTYFQALNSKKYRTPVALSTIYWIDSYPGQSGLSYLKSKVMLPWRVAKVALASGQQGEAGRDLKRQRIADFTIDALTQHREVLNAADVWLPNGIEEYRQIVSNTGLEKEYRVIPNAIDEELLTMEETPVTVPGGDFALCVAAITPRKNQLQLIRIANELGIGLVLAGSYRIDHDSYFVQCQAAAMSNTVFAGELSDSQLAYLYRRARIHVLPSIYETPGLSSLEAALFGCPIATTGIGAVHEYFGDEAFYCDPYDYESIKSSVAAAWGAPRNETLKNRVLTEYTWSNVARMTADAYKMLLEHRG
jgi:glycosyltransferase involved in cell wall biosynthesis